MTAPAELLDFSPHSVGILPDAKLKQRAVHNTQQIMKTLSPVECGEIR
jgi:hypothetical protein